jgi:TPR repeat protein
MDQGRMLGLVLLLAVAGLSSPARAQTDQAAQWLQQGLAAQKAQDFSDAFHYFLMAAVAGNADAQYRVGYCYLTGEGVQQDEITAVKWFQQGAAQGEPQSEFHLASCYEHGWGGLYQDLDQARRWYQAAQQQGYPGAAEALKNLAAVTPIPDLLPGTPTPITSQGRIFDGP